MEQEELNELLENKYKIHIIKENDEYYYKLSDIYNITMSDMAENYSKEYNKNIIYRYKGCRYLNKEGLIFVLSHAENGLKEEFIEYNSFFKYDNKLYFNKEATDLIKEHSDDLVYTIENEQILFRAMDIVEKFFKNTSINMMYIRKYFQNYLYKIKYRKSLYINMEGIKILQFIHNNNTQSIDFLKEYNSYYENNLFKDLIFKNAKRFVKNNVIYYKLKDLSVSIDSFGSVSTIVEKYITDYIPFDNLEEYYLNKKQAIEFIEKANTIKSINLCIKYNLNNQIVNELNLEEYIESNEIILSNKKVRTFTYENKHVLFCLQDFYKILGYENSNSINYYKIHNGKIRDFITSKYLKELLEFKISNAEYILRNSNLYDIINLSYQLELNIEINNKNIFPNIIDEGIIHFVKDDLTYFSELIKHDKFSPDITKNVRFISYNNITYIVVENIIDKIFNNTKDKFGDRFQFVLVKNKDKLNMLKIIEFQSFMLYISRMKKPQAIKIREEFGIIEKFTPILENTTIPIIESAFPDIKFERQYKIKYDERRYYYLDTAIVKYKIDIECDEYDHKTYDKIGEKRREEFLTNNGWIQLRYNPLQPETIGKVIYDIIVILKKYNNI